MRDLGVLIPILGIMCGLLAIIGGVFVKPWLRLKEKQMSLISSNTAEKAAQYAAHVERLEQRVRVLERIVTDKGLAVADQIEALRDPQPAPAEPRNLRAVESAPELTKGSRV